MLILVLIIVQNLSLNVNAKEEIPVGSIDLHDTTTKTVTSNVIVHETVFEFQIIPHNWNGFLGFFFLFQTFVVFGLIIIKSSLLINARYGIISK